MNCEEKFFGSVTVGERGQVVIPADARTKFNINSGDKLLAMAHPMGKGLIFFKLEDAREILDYMSKTIGQAIAAAEETPE